MTLSPTQQKVLDTLAAAGASRLVRRPGGFWTYPACLNKGKTDVPLWYVTVNTVRALEHKGYLERTFDYPEEWRDTRRLKCPAS